jgi:hypothetical protein
LIPIFALQVDVCEISTWILVIGDCGSAACKSSSPVSPAVWLGILVKKTLEYLRLSQAFLEQWRRTDPRNRIKQ